MSPPSLTHDFRQNIRAYGYAGVVAQHSAAATFPVLLHRLDSSEAAGGINAGDSFSAPTGYVSPVLDHADYQVIFSSNTLNFSLAGTTITASAVPVPAAIWMFGSALAAMGVVGRRRQTC